MATCSCGKTIEKIPRWMSDIKVEFVCNNCPNRSTKNIALISFAPPQQNVKEEKIDEPELADDAED